MRPNYYGVYSSMMANPGSHRESPGNRCGFPDFLLIKFFRKKKLIMINPGTCCGFPEGSRILHHLLHIRCVFNFIINLIQFGISQLFPFSINDFNWLEPLSRRVLLRFNKSCLNQLYLTWKLLKMCSNYFSLLLFNRGFYWRVDNISFYLYLT